MDRVVLVMAILGGEPHALPFATETACWRWATMFNLDPTPLWVGTCMTETEYREMHPSLTLDVGS